LQRIVMIALPTHTLPDWGNAEQWIVPIGIHGRGFAAMQESVGATRLIL